ncbi:MAG: endonuclease NucS domain-containing protein [Terriglobales bacterium]|jgi:hypothetical protein
MANERDFEDVLVRYPELIEEGLRLIGRQVVVCGRRIDLLFEDKLRQTLVVELKWGPIKDEHVGQIMYYQGALLSGREPVRTMLVGTRVPAAIQRSLDFNGLASKEIRLSTLVDFLKSKGETDVVRTFEADLPLADAALKSNVPSRVVKRTAAQPATDTGSLALFALVKEHWLQEAFAYFESAGGNKELRFSANSPHLGPALGLRIEKVYFKASGKNDVIALARFLSIETENPGKNRLPGYDETCESWNARFYYGFCDLSWTKNRIPVTSLCRYPSGKPLRNDVPGACIIYDIATD